MPNSGPMKMAARFSVAAFHVAAFGADQVARPGGECGEGDLVFLVRLLHAGGLEVFQDHLGEVLLALRIPASTSLTASINSSFSSTPSTRCGQRLSTVNGPATRTFFLSS